MHAYVFKRKSMVLQDLYNKPTLSRYVIETSFFYFVV